MKRRLTLFQTSGEIIVARHYFDKRLIVCGICGNMVPEKLYLEDDCPHCHMGIGYEVGTKGSNMKTARLEFALRDF